MLFKKENGLFVEYSLRKEEHNVENECLSLFVHEQFLQLFVAQGEERLL